MEIKKVLGSGLSQGHSTSYKNGHVLPDTDDGIANVSACFVIHMQTLPLEVTLN